jgi:CheY-like chemotaxis protein
MKPILVVEDNPNEAALTLRALKKNNIPNPIVVAKDGAEALDYLFGTGVYADREMDRPHFVLLDLNLPNVDGHEVLRRLRADSTKAALPVVILSSSREERDIVNGYRLGCNSYIRKPVDFNEFVEAARQLGQYWLILNEVPAGS